MKRLIVILMLVCMTAGFGFSQALDQKALTDALGGFATSMTTALPYNSSIGLSWSDAYIGQLLAVPPHFGIGVTAGATFIPLKGIEKLVTDLGSSLPEELKDLAAVGLPIPAAVIDARIGGFFLPFDIGLKGIAFDRSLLKSFGVKDIDVDYMNIGADFRYALIEQNLALPNVSVGVGFNYLNAAIGMPSNISRETFDFPGNNKVTFEPGNISLKWDSAVVELKAQISKNLLIITPYLGGGVSMNWSKIGGGLDADVKINGVPATDAEIKTLLDAAKAMGITNLPDISAKGLYYLFPANGLGLRVFGGFSLNILVIKLDVTAMYNIMDSALGASLGVRFQL